MKYTKELVTEALERTGGNKQRAAELLNVPVSTFKGAVQRLKVRVPKKDSNKKEPPNLEVDDHGNHCVISLRSKTIKDPEEALKEANVDQDVWEIERFIVNKWDMAAKANVSMGEGVANSNVVLLTNELWQVKVWLRRKEPIVCALEAILERIGEKSPKVPRIKRKPSKTYRRALEICVMDPHLGLQCYRPGSDSAWSLELCEEYFLWAIETLLEKADHYGPFEELIWVFGNDFLHADSLEHTTTKGTLQPEMTSLQTTYERGIELAVAAADILKKHSPLRIIQVSGNHDRLLSFTIGHVLKATYRNDPNVEVEVNSEPYKFWAYGVNLVGFDHGHSPKLDRLAALMANETRLTHWKDARYCEWHLGDQHRKGSGRPTVMAEQGVGIEFLTGLTPANEWHKLKTFNWQTRGAVAYVWDYNTGPESRLHVNIDSYSGRPMGEEESK